MTTWLSTDPKSKQWCYISNSGRILPFCGLCINKAWSSDHFCQPVCVLVCRPACVPASVARVPICAYACPCVCTAGVCLLYISGCRVFCRATCVLVNKVCAICVYLLQLLQSQFAVTFILLSWAITAWTSQLCSMQETL